MGIIESFIIMKVILVNQPWQTAHLGNTKQRHGIFRVIRKKKRRYAIGYKGFGDFLTSPCTHPLFLFIPLPLLRAYRKKASLEVSMTIIFVWKWMFFFFSFTFQVQDQWTLQKEIDMNCKGPQTNMPENVRSKKTWSAEIGQQKLQARYFLIEVHVKDIRFPLVNNICRAKL